MPSGCIGLTVFIGEHGDEPRVSCFASPSFETDRMSLTGVMEPFRDRRIGASADRRYGASP